MASHRRPKPPARTRVTVLTATAAAAVALSGQSAVAAPGGPDKDEVKTEVDALYDEAERATEKFNGAREHQERLEKEIAQLQDAVARDQGELNDLRNTLGSLAAAQYRGGGIDPSVALLLSADPETYLDKAATLQQLTGRQLEAVARIQAKQRTLAQQRQEAAGKLADLDAARKELAGQKKAAQGKLAEAQALLNTLSAQDRSRLRAEEAGRSRAGEKAAPAVNASGRAAAALAAAKTKLGSAYVMGATGPGAYDCSGLTQWAYGQAGIGITRTTYTQANEGTRIGRSQLQPGDLVFFYDDLHHVGLYAGNNTTLHASNPRGGVKYESMDNMPFQFGVRI
ncbi:NlpC/P60 family protein [Streptomyces sp. NPDC090077]|uniref:C40 family peptidase n=1 Tax=Streptomyces sp. NPDC090077 TaxID=3365938 RepID=UPI00380D4878